MYETQLLSRLYGQTAQVVHGLVAQTSFPGPFPGSEVARLEERLTVGSPYVTLVRNQFEQTGRD